MRQGHSIVKGRGALIESLESRRLLSAAFPGGVENAIGYDPVSQNLYLAYYDETNGGSLRSALRDSAGKEKGS